MQSLGDVARLDRRSFMAVVVATAVAAACGDSGGDGSGQGPGGAAGSTVPDEDLPPLPEDLPAGLFSLGVASGDPLPGAVILWTRLVADPLVAGGGMGESPVPVGWEVATDEAITDVVASGHAVADPVLAHSVHVDATGLEPDTWYWYRFTVGDRTSPVGRTRTAPAEGAAVDRLRFAVASCQNFQNGYWPAHDHLAEEDLDLVLFLGDYIYEGGSSSGGPRSYRTGPPTDLVTYRQRWGEYKADQALRRSHQRFPWVCTWDDHEVENNYADDVPEAARDDGADPGEVLSREEFLARRAAAYQVYYEHLPLRLEPPEDHDLRIYRAAGWGDLARFYVLDTRQYRTPQADCDAGVDLPVSDAGPACEDARDPDRTLLGDEQEAWLEGELASSGARWNLLAQQVVMSRVPFVELDGEGVFNLDQWDGYPAARRRVVEALGAASNPVVLSGDIHLHGLSVVTAEPGDPDATPVVTEVVGTSISSDFPLPELAEGLAGTLPEVRYVNARQRGYVVCELSPETLRVWFRVVSTVEEPQAELATDASWIVRSGDPVPVEA